jgi:anti-anti-sigma factor
METPNAHHTALGTGPDAHVEQTTNQTVGGEPWVREPPHRSPLPEELRIVERIADGRRVIALCGELDLSNAALLEERLAGKIDTVLDLSGLSFIDSSGISVLITTAQRARSQAWTFSAQNAQPAVLRVIKLVGIDQHLGLGSPNGAASHPDEDSHQTDAAEKHASG